MDGQPQAAGLSKVEHTMLSPLLPDLTWLKGYSRVHFGHDVTAAVVVTIMLIPQSLAYALLAGLPAEMGLYASILPLVAYALFGSSRTLSVGPVAVIALMTATAVGNVSSQGTADYATAAVLLALLSGAILILLGILRFGFVTNFLSHPRGVRLYYRLGGVDCAQSNSPSPRYLSAGCNSARVIGKPLERDRRISYADLFGG